MGVTEGSAKAASGSLFQGKYELQQLVLRTPDELVYRAQHKAIERIVEVHVLPPGLDGDST